MFIIYANFMIKFNVNNVIIHSMVHRYKKLTQLASPFNTLEKYSGKNRAVKWNLESFFSQMKAQVILTSLQSFTITACRDEGFNYMLQHHIRKISLSLLTK